MDGWNDSNEGQSLTMMPASSYGIGAHQTIRTNGQHVAAAFWGLPRNHKTTTYKFTTGCCLATFELKPEVIIIVLFCRSLIGCVNVNKQTITYHKNDDEMASEQKKE